MSSSEYQQALATTLIKRAQPIAGSGGLPGFSCPQPQGPSRSRDPNRAQLDDRFYNTENTAVEAAKFARGLDTLTRLPLAVFLCSSDPSTVVTFLRMFPLFTHGSMQTGASQGGSVVTLALACLVATDPAEVRIQVQGAGFGNAHTLCADPWTANFFIGTTAGMMWAPASVGSNKHYGWAARSPVAAHCVHPTFTGGFRDLDALRVVTSTSTNGDKQYQLVLKAYALPAPDTKAALDKQVRLAVIPSIDAETVTTVVCWGLAKGTQGAPDKLLVAVLDAQTAAQAWRLEDLICTTATVELQCGTDKATLDLNRATCVLGPRTYVSLAPKGSAPGQERLTVVGVWHEQPTPGWRLYAQTKSFYSTRLMGTTSLIGASQVHPLGPNSYSSKAAFSVKKAVNVPAGRESYLDSNARNVGPFKDPVESYERVGTFRPELDAYYAAVGSRHKVLDVQDSRGGTEIGKVYQNHLDAKTFNQ